MLLHVLWHLFAFVVAFVVACFAFVCICLHLLWHLFAFVVAFVQVCSAYMFANVLTQNVNAGTDVSIYVIYVST